MILYKDVVAEVLPVYRKTKHFKAKLTKSQEAFEFITQFYNKDTISYIESSFVVYLNRSNNTIGFTGLSIGSTEACFIDSKVLFSLALGVGAHAIILCHNHPSGNIDPSEADKAITKQLKEAGKLLGIRLQDHLIITEDKYYSFADEGLL